MKQFGYLALLTALLVLLSACGGTEVDESLLPTRIPTIDVASFAITIQPPTATATTEPTVEPTVEATLEPTVESTTGAVDTANPTPGATLTTPEPEPEIDSADVVTSATNLLPTATVVSLPTTEITVTVDVTSTNGVTETGNLTDTGDITQTDGLTDTTEADGTEADGTGADGTGADGTETDSTETDGTGTDGTGADGTGTDSGKTDGSESTSADEVDATTAPSTESNVDEIADVTTDETPEAESVGIDDTALEETDGLTNTIPAVTNPITTTLEPEESETTSRDAITNTAGITPTSSLTATSALSSTDALTFTQPTTGTNAIETEGGEGASAPSTTASSDEAQGADELPAEVAEALEAANPVKGQQLTLVNACIGCHSMDPEQTMVGPTWHNLPETATTRVDGQDAELYLYNSIVHPNSFVNEGYPANVMIQTYGQTLAPQDLADMIAYLLTLEVE